MTDMLNALAQSLPVDPARVITDLLKLAVTVCVIDLRARSRNYDSLGIRKSVGGVSPPSERQQTPVLFCRRNPSTFVIRR
jgi:hypothetical protein